MSDFPLWPPEEMAALLAFDELLFEHRCLLEYRRLGYSFAWISQHTGLTERQVEDTQVAALRLLADSGIPHDELRREYRLTRAQLAHVLGPEPGGTP
jgi:hypothetical protein